MRTSTGELKLEKHPYHYDTKLICISKETFPQHNLYLIIVYLGEFLIWNLKFLLYANFNISQCLAFMNDQEKGFSKVLNLLLSKQCILETMTQDGFKNKGSHKAQDKYKFHTIWFCAVSLLKWYTWIKRSWGPRFFSSSGIWYLHKK